MADVHYTEPTLLDLDAILDFIAQRSDLETATNFVTFHLLADMPNIG